MATYKAVSYETGSGVCLFHIVASCILKLALTNCKSCRTQHLELPHDAHKTQTYNICMTKHSHFPYTNTCSSTHHNTNRKHNIHHIHYTTNIPTDPHTITTTDIKTIMCHIHTYIVSRHLATRANNKILHTPSPHIRSSEGLLEVLKLYF